jgi:hypothetical protein
MADDFQNSNLDLASLPAAPNLKFEREDWTSFRTIEGLTQKAGVSKNKLSRLVLKEIADNGLDTGTDVEIGELPEGGYFVADSGPGIDGTPEEIARLFSISRPMISTKLLRLPRELIAELDGCTGGKAGEIVAAAGLRRSLCKNVTQEQAAILLATAQELAKPVRPERLGAAGAELFGNSAYACVRGTAEFGSGELPAEIPFVVEAWAKPDEATAIGVCVNRTPVTGNIEATREKREINIYGCGLADTVAQAPKEAQFRIWLNVITPFMPITSDGKEPDLEPFLDEIQTTIGKAVRKAHRPKGSSGASQKDVVLNNLDAVIAEVSGDGEFRFNARQLFYALRPIVMEATGEELKIGNFTAIITDYEEEFGEIEGMYREPRGSITHPHRDETITLGTLMVEEYERPEWTFNKLMYVEKEGANEALKAVRWPEQHDAP